MKLSYSEQLRHPNWQRVRLLKLEAAEWQCEVCGDDGTTLHVHHKQYFRGRKAWEYSLEELEVRCEPCHDDAHDVDDRLKRLLSIVDPAEALVLLSAFHYGESETDEISAFAKDRDFHLFCVGLAALEINGLPITEVIEIGARAQQARAERLSTAIQKFRLVAAG